MTDYNSLSEGQKTRVDFVSSIVGILPSLDDYRKDVMMKNLIANQLKYLKENQSYKEFRDNLLRILE